MKGKHFALILALIPILSAPVLAEMYYWTDDNGVKRFSNQPPPAGVRAQSAFTEIVSSPAAPLPDTQVRTPDTPPAKTQPTDSGTTGAPGPEQQGMLDARTQLAGTYNQLIAAKQGLAAQRSAVPRRPRAQSRKKHRVINADVVAVNRQIAEYEKQRQAFNDDPRRHKYRIELLPELTAIPYPKYGQDKSSGSQ